MLHAGTHERASKSSGTLSLVASAAIVVSPDHTRDVLMSFDWEENGVK